MKSLKIITVSILVLPIMAFGQSTATTLPNPGLTPDSPFYFLNRVGEALQEFFTFNPEAKARLELQFAAERISEIKAMLVEKGVATPGIEAAKVRLTENLARASGAVIKVKSSGKDIVELAKEVSEKISFQKSALKGVFEDEDDNLSEQEKDLKEQIKKADKAKDVEKAKKLVKNLSALGDKRDALKKHEDESSQDFDDEEENVDKVFELKDRAQNAIDDAKEERAELLVEIPEIIATDLSLADKAIASAEDLFAKENYQAAKELADQAEKALERAEDAFEKKNEDNEDEDDVDDIIKKYKEVKEESAKELKEIDQEFTKKLEEINRENEKKQWELNNEIEELSNELENFISTEEQ